MAVDTGHRRATGSVAGAAGALAALTAFGALAVASCPPARAAATPAPQATSTPATGRGVPGPTSTSSGNGLNGPPGASVTPLPGRARPAGGDLARGATSNAEVLKLVLEPAVLTGGGNTDPQGVSGLHTEIDVVTAQGRFVDDVTGLLSPYRKPEVNGAARSGLLAGTVLGQQLPAAPGTASADFSHPKASVTGMRLPAGLPASGGQGDSTAAVDKPARVATSAASGGNLSIGSLGDILPAGLVSPLRQGIGSVAAAAAPVTGQLATLLGQLAAAGLPAPLADAVAGLQAQVPGLQAALDAVLSAPLLQLKDVTSTQGVRMSGRTVTSTARSRLGTISLLGGLVTISGTDSSVTAVAGGLPGTASVTTHQVPGTVRHGSIPGAARLASGLTSLTAGLAGLSCPDAAAATCAALQTLGTQLTTAYARFSGALSLPSSTPSIAKPVTNTDPGGTEADARYAGLELLIGPPDSSGKLPTDPSKALLTLEAGVAEAQAQSTAAPAVDIGTPPGRLAYTGGPGPWPAAAACVLGAAGLLVRRRRRAAQHG